MFHNFLTFLVTASLAISTFFGNIANNLSPQPLGASFTPVQTQKTYLSGAGVGSTDTSINLTSLKFSDGSTNITMSNFGSVGFATIDPGVPKKEENISFTGITQNANGSAVLTGVSRGLLPYSPYTASSTWAYSHAGASAVVVSNSSAFYNQFAIANNTTTVAANWTFSSTTIPQFSAGTTNAQISANTLNVASVNYVNNVASSGAPNADTITKGIIQLSTSAQVASGTAQGGGSTGASLVPDTSLFGATSSARTQVPVTNSSGKLSQGFLDLTQPFSFSGGVSSTGNTTLGTTTVNQALTIATTSVSGGTIDLSGASSIIGITHLIDATTTIISTFSSTASTTIASVSVSSSSMSSSKVTGLKIHIDLSRVESSGAGNSVTFSMLFNGTVVATSSYGNGAISGVLDAEIYSSSTINGFYGGMFFTPRIGASGGMTAFSTATTTGAYNTSITTSATSTATLIIKEQNVANGGGDGVTTRQSTSYFVTQ